MGPDVKGSWDDEHRRSEDGDNSSSEEGTDDENEVLAAYPSDRRSAVQDRIGSSSEIGEDTCEVDTDDEMESDGEIKAFGGGSWDMDSRDVLIQKATVDEATDARF